MPEFEDVPNYLNNNKKPNQQSSAPQSREHVVFSNSASASQSEEDLSRPDTETGNAAQSTAASRPNMRSRWKRKGAKAKGGESSSPDAARKIGAVDNVSDATDTLATSKTQPAGAQMDRPRRTDRRSAANNDEVARDVLGEEKVVADFKNNSQSRSFERSFSKELHTASPKPFKDEVKNDMNKHHSKSSCCNRTHSKKKASFFSKLWCAITSLFGCCDKKTSSTRCHDRSEQRHRGGSSRGRSRNYQGRSGQQSGYKSRAPRRPRTSKES